MKTQTARSSPATPPQSGLVLRRKCACGGSSASGECEECKKNEVQRKPAGPGGPAVVPAFVPDVLSLPGRPLDAQTRSFFEPRFAHDFSRVRVHAGVEAADSARALNARAYTFGHHVVFGAGQFAPGTTGGRRLLAHELAHVVQQRGVSQRNTLAGARLGREGDAWEQDAERQSERVANAAPADPSGPALTQPQIQRSSFTSFFSDFFSSSAGPIKAIARAFGSENYTDAELTTYLTKITNDKKIEDRYDSDNKARAVVKRWQGKKPGFSLTTDVKILLIREMQSGYTSGDDEQGILTILHNSSLAEQQQIFGPGGIDPKVLDSDFSGANAKDLRALYDQLFEGGAKAVLAGSKELKQHVQHPLVWAEFKKVLDQRYRRIQSTVNGAAEAERETLATEEAQKSAGEVYSEMSVLDPPEREQGLQDMAGERSRQDSILSDVNFKKDDPAVDAKAKDALARQSSAVEAYILMLDLILQSTGKDVAMAAPKDAKAFAKGTKALTPAEQKAASAALKPLTHEEVVAEVSGAPPPKAPKFVQTLPGEKVGYDDQIRARAPKIVDESYDRYGKPRSEAVHSDPSKTHQLSELETIANVSKNETDQVFGNFKVAPVFKADKFNKKGLLIKAGNIKDAWLSEQAKFKGDPTYQDSSARFWMFYLLENDNEVKQIEYKHNASPSLDDKQKPLNDEAKVIAEVGNKYAKSDAKRLFEIGRGWDAFNIKRGVSVQLFKNPDATEDRRFLWDMFYTLIHEYLHSLADGKYNAHAEKLGGEASPQGNTLIEGVDSLLTETVWTNARPHAADPAVRQAVEPDAVKAGEPFDDSLVPQTPWRRYASYPQAVKLVSVVGIHNLYDAYFHGNVKAIGG
jgi:hypothetical protein